MSIAALFLWGVMGLMVVFVTAYGMAMVSAFSTIMRVRWLEKRQNRRHNRALRAALLACPGRQLMFRVVDGRMVVEVEGDAPTTPPSPSGVTLNWMDDEQAEEAIQ